MVEPKYFDQRSEFWRRHFAQSSDYATYLSQSDPAKALKWPVMSERIPELSSEQIARLSGYNRSLNVLVFSGVWCGDCVRQGPMLQRIAAAGERIDLRWIDREASKELGDALRMLGALRVPQAVFLSEDFFEMGRFGDRLLTAYRAKAARELGPACDTGMVAPPPEQLASELEEWVAIFERMLLMLRLAPSLRERYQD